MSRAEAGAGAADSAVVAASAARSRIRIVREQDARRTGSVRRFLCLLRPSYAGRRGSGQARMPHVHPPSRMLSDERLAVLAGAGDDNAFSVLYSRHEKALLGYCRSITREREDARDALQTAMAGAYAGLAARPAGAPVRAWLFRITHNEAVNVLRRRRPEVPLSDGDRAAASAADETATRAAARD